ncbi:MAG: NUDIX hydrolase [Bacteroidota bacterium]
MSLSSSPKFQLWRQNLLRHGLEINKIEEVFTRYKSDGDLLFGLVLLDATTPEGDKIPPVCFIKGLIVSVLVCLIDEKTGEKYALLVRQRRICNGDFVYETVAGMVDGDDDPHTVAVKETAEETGLVVHPSQVILLNEEPHYVSTGTSDEAMFFYYCELEMSREKIFSYHNQQQGLISEHERIITEVVPLMQGLHLIRNVNGLLNIHLYLQQKGVKP